MTSKLRGEKLLLQLLTGDPIEAMEAAKNIIGLRGVVAPELLLEIARNRVYKRWSRTGAVYALGFIRYKPSVTVLADILENPDEVLDLRCHAAESLGNLQYSQSISSLERILKSDEPKSLKRWCIYALSQIPSRHAAAVLKEIGQIEKKGIIAKEIRTILGWGR